MTWNWLDILVILCLVGQIAAVVAVAQVVGRIRRGAVARVSAMVGRTVDGGKRLVATGKTAGEKSLPHVLAIRDATVKLPRALRPVSLTDAPVSYGSLRRNIAALAVLRVAKSGGRGTAPRRPAVSFAERTGLVPPVWKKVAPLWQYAGIGYTVWQEVQKQIAEVQKRGVALKDTDAAQETAD